MPVTHQSESMPVSEVVENFIVSLHQSGASPHEIINGVMRAFNGRDGIIINSEPNDTVDTRTLALKVEEDLNRVKSDLVSFARQSIG